MGGNEVEIGGAHLRRRHAHQPGFQVAAVASDQSVDQQRRQRKVVDHMGFVGVAEVSQILAVGNVGFRNDNALGGVVFNQQAQNLDQFVGLLQMDGRRTHLFP